jgi:phage-related protein
MAYPTLNLPVKWAFQQSYDVNHLNTKLGDSYQQFSYQGVSFDDQFKETLQVSAVLTQAEKDALDILLRNWLGVQRFLWSPIPDEITPRAFVCETWNFKELGVDTWEFSAAFEKTVDAPGLYVAGGGSDASLPPPPVDGGTGGDPDEDDGTSSGGEAAPVEETGYIVTDDGSYVVDDSGVFVTIIENARVKVRYQWEVDVVAVDARPLCTPVWELRTEVWAGDYNEGLRPPVTASAPIFTTTGTDTAGTAQHYFTVTFDGLGNSGVSGTKDLFIYSGVTGGPDSCYASLSSMAPRVRNFSYTVEAWP